MMMGLLQWVCVYCEQHDADEKASPTLEMEGGEGYE
jgi:hypothetical protein